MRFFIVILMVSVFVMPAWTPAQGQEGAPGDTVGTAEVEGVSKHVGRAVFATAINEREPTDTVDVLTTDVDKVFFFSEIVDMEGKTVIHRWLHGGETKADVPFDIGGPRWRVYSSKTLIPEWSGTWTVEVRDGDGNTLHTASFEYRKPE